MPDIDIGTAHGKIVLHDGFLPVLKQANAELAASKRAMARDFGEIRDLGKSVAKGMIAVSGAGIAAGAALVKVAADMQQTSVAFTTLLKSGTAAAAMLGDLRAFAEKTPFEFPEVLNAAKKMMALGFAARDVIPMLTAVGDAASGLGLGAQGLDRIITALGQMQAKAKVSAEEMMQLTEAGIPAWEYLSQAIGKSTAETMKLAEKGVIPADKAIQALLGGMSGQFGNMMAKQAETFNGKLSNLKDSVGRLADSLGQVLLPEATRAVDKLRGIVDVLNGMPASTRANLAEWGKWGVGLVGTGGVITAVTIGLADVINKLRTANTILGTTALGKFTGVGAVAAAAAAAVGGAVTLAANETTARRERMKVAAAYQAKLPTEISGLWYEYENNPPGSARATQAAWELQKRGWRLSEMGPLPPHINGPVPVGQVSQWDLQRWGFRETAQGVERTAQATPAQQIETGIGGWKPGGGSSGRSSVASGPTPQERELQRLEDAYEFAKLSGNEAQIASARAALLAFLQRHAGRSGFGLEAMRRLSAVRDEARNEQLDLGRRTQAADRAVVDRIRGNMQFEADQEYRRLTLDREREQERQRQLRERAAGYYEYGTYLFGNAAGAVAGAVTGAATGLTGLVRGAGQEARYDAGLLRRTGSIDTLLSGTLGTLQGVGAIGSMLAQAGGAIGSAMKRSMSDAIDFAQQRYREWQRDAEENWQRVGRAMWWSGQRGGMGQVMSDLGAGASGRLWERTWGGLQGLGENLAGWVRNNTFIGRALDRNGIGLSDLIGAAGAVSNIAEGQGGFLGGAMSGASLGGFFGPLGAGIGALAGGFISAIFQADNEEERRHREAQERRDRIREGIERMQHTLEPVADYFRGLGLAGLSAGMTYGGGLAGEAALGARG